MIFLYCNHASAAEHILASPALFQQKAEIIGKYNAPMTSKKTISTGTELQKKKESC